MIRIDRAYVALAIALLLIGELLGLYMGLMSDMKLRMLHVTIQLVGFVTLMLFGFTYRLWPAMKTGMLAAVQFWLAAVGVLGIVVGTYQYVTTGAVMIVAHASIVFIIATILLAWLFWTRRRYLNTITAIERHGLSKTVSQKSQDGANFNWP